MLDLIPLLVLNNWRTDKKSLKKPFKKLTFVLVLSFFTMFLNIKYISTLGVWVFFIVMLPWAIVGLKYVQAPEEDTGKHKRKKM